MSANEKQVGGEHYRKQKIQHWDYVISNEIPYMEAQIIKYVSRWRGKNGVEDLRKAQHFLEKLLETETSGAPTTITIKPTGYEGFTYEGGTADSDLYRCLYCKGGVKMPRNTPPYCAPCALGMAGPGYTNQG